MRFRPGLGPTLFLVFGLVLLSNLGLWQLRRHRAQEVRLAHVEERLAAPPVTALPPAPSAEALDWRMARLTGRFEEEPLFLVTGRFEHGRPGYDVVQPFRAEAGPRLLVNRGWIPREDLDRVLARIAPGAAEQTIEGLLQAVDPARARAPIPASDIAPERWHPHAYAGMIARLEGPVAPLVLVAGAPLPPGATKPAEPLPITGFVARPKTIGHLEYAVTWFLVAGTLVAVWTALGLRRGRVTAEAAGPSAPRAADRP